MRIEEHITTFLTYAIPIYVVSFLIYVIRVIKGPTVPDRVLAVDALSFDLAAFLVIIGILLKIPFLVPIAMVLSLWIYALDVYIAKYLEAKEMGD
ncbi:MAG: pH regulation protein F [Desulfurococcales archaeon ex4484_42]|nr:MAG: pH regulation protein F [Desulfurococcales archaeon ex4484_42]